MTDNENPNNLGRQLGNPSASDWSMANDVKCEECGHDIFVQGVYLQKLSKLIALTDKDMVRPIPTFCCAKCGHVNSEFAMKPAVVKMPKVS